jgi:hypothetical protein
MVDGDGDVFVDVFTRHADAVANYAFRRTAEWSTRRGRDLDGVPRRVCPLGRLRV